MDGMLHETPQGPQLCKPVAYTVGVDWFSGTLPRTDATQVGWFPSALRTMQEIEAEGERLERRVIYGYTGVGTGGCFLGENEERYLLVISGERADRFWQKHYRPEMHVSRIDMQITVQYDKEVLDIAERSYQNAAAHNEQRQKAHRRKLYLVLGSDGANTCYVGAPSQENRLCIYNKAKQSGDERYTNAWRFEFRSRNDRATAYAYSLAARNGDYREAIVSAVLAECADRGIPLPIDRRGEGLVFDGPKRLASEIDAKLWWLAHQVKPTVTWLRKRGRVVDLMAALGLDKPAEEAV